MSRKHVAWALAMSIVGGMALTSAFADGHGEKIEFSDPAGSSAVESNITANINPGANRLNPTGGFKQMEEDFFRPLKNSIHSVDSMGGVLSVPIPGPQQQQPRQVLSKRAKELMDQRRNWAFTDLNDLYPEQTPEEALGLKDFGDDSNDKQPISVMQRFYERQGKKPDKDKDNQFGLKMDANGHQDFAGTNSFMPQKEEFPEIESYSKNPFSQKPSSVSGARSGGSFESVDVSTANADDLLAQQRHHMEFQHLLNPNMPMSKMPNYNVNTTLNGLGLEQYSPKVTFSSILGQDDPTAQKLPQAASQPHRSSINPDLNIPDPNAIALHSRVNDDPTASALGLPNPVQVQIAPPAKTADSVKKMLDPFAAGLGKPKF